MEHPLEQAIRERAYYLWVASGCTEGDADRHWLAAERELLASAAPAIRGKAPRKSAPRARTKARSRAA